MTCNFVTESAIQINNTYDPDVHVLYFGIWDFKRELGKKILGLVVNIARECMLDKYYDFLCSKKSLRVCMSYNWRETR